MCLCLCVQRRECMSECVNSQLQLLRFIGTLHMHTLGSQTIGSLASKCLLFQWRTKKQNTMCNGDFFNAFTLFFALTHRVQIQIKYTHCICKLCVCVCASAVGLHTSFMRLVSLLSNTYYVHRKCCIQSTDSGKWPIRNTVKWYENVW